MLRYMRLHVVANRSARLVIPPPGARLPAQDARLPAQDALLRRRTRGSDAERNHSDATLLLS